MGIAKNLAIIRSRIENAARISGRSANEVTLIAVSKYVDLDATKAIVDAGCQNLGEARPQDLWRKAAALGDLVIQWHLIGHLQTNKVRRTLPIVSLIHS